MNNRGYYRIYGKTLNIWRNDDGRITQRELAYTGYDADGTICEVGSADFNGECLNRFTREATVWTWDGKKRNKGGHRWFERREHIRYEKGDAKLVKEHFKRKYGAEVVELRGW